MPNILQSCSIRWKARIIYFFAKKKDRKYNIQTNPKTIAYPKIIKWKKPFPEKLY